MTTSNFNIIRETEKAINVEIKIIVGGRGEEIMWKFWIPKSVAKIENDTLEAPMWSVGPKTPKHFVAFV